MSIKKILRVFTVLSLCIVVPPITVSAQNYDYHREESPAISWNGTALFDARMLAAGGISLMASPAFSASINPALIPAGNDIIIGGSAEMMNHQAFQYWAINQGVYRDPDPQSDENLYLSGLSFVFPLKSLRFSVGWYVGSLLELPAFDFDNQSWAYSLTSPGIENNFFAGAAFKLGKSIDIGLKLDIVSGKRDVSIDETWKDYPVRFQREERHRLSYAAPSIGVLLKISPTWTMGAAVIYPLAGKAKRSIDRIFESNYELIEILDLESTDTLYRPVRLYLGTTFSPFIKDKKLTFAGEVIYTFWKDYRYEFYSETLPREMRNTLVLALGLEYGLSGNQNDYFVRIGYRLDPQPITNPKILPQAVSGGFGLRIGHVSLDIGAMYYFSSYQGIKQKQVVLNSTLYIRL